MWREGHTWEKGDLQATKRTLSRKAGAAAASPLGSLQFQVSRSATGQGAACVARLGEQGETARRGPERAKGGGGQSGCPAYPGRVTAAAARGRGRRRGGVARGVSPPSLRERGNMGARTGGRAGWVALARPPTSAAGSVRSSLTRAAPGSTTWAAAGSCRNACTVRSRGAPEPRGRVCGVREEEEVGGRGPHRSPGWSRDPPTCSTQVPGVVTAETHPHLPRVFPGTSLLPPWLCK